MIEPLIEVDINFIPAEPDVGLMTGGYQGYATVDSGCFKTCFTFSDANGPINTWQIEASYMFKDIGEGRYMQFGMTHNPKVHFPFVERDLILQDIPDVCRAVESKMKEKADGF